MFTDGGPHNIKDVIAGGEGLTTDNDGAAILSQTSPMDGRAAAAPAQQLSASRQTSSVSWGASSLLGLLGLCPSMATIFVKSMYPTWRTSGLVLVWSCEELHMSLCQKTIGKCAMRAS
jgi:hypothetical protein